MTMRKVTGLGLYIIALLALFSPARGADRLTLSSTNPTALEIDQMVAARKDSSPGRISISMSPT